MEPGPAFYRAGTGHATAGTGSAFGEVPSGISIMVQAVVTLAAPTAVTLAVPGTITLAAVGAVTLAALGAIT